jgi:hypothetical protein
VEECKGKSAKGNVDADAERLENGGEGHDIWKHSNVQEPNKRGNK